MAEEGLKIKIGADVQSAVTSLNTLNTSLAKTSQAAVNVGSAGMNNLTKGTAQASTALTNFSRVASDAPFGLIGIANNIDPLVQSFIQLRKETGSGKAALAALTASLTGGGGLILAISLITSALQFAQLGLSRWGQSTKEAKDETKNAKDELDKYVEAQKNSVRNLTEQTLKIEGLVSVAKNLNLSEKERIAAINELNKILPDNIGLITKQNILTAEGDQILKKYITTIEARATAELLAGKIAENNVKLFENANNLLRTRETTQAEITKKEREAFILSNSSIRNQKTAAFIRINIKNSQERLIKLQEDERKNAELINKENEKLRQEYLKQIELSNALNDATGKSAQTSSELVNVLKRYNEELKGINWDEQNRQIDGTKKRLELAGETLKNLYLAGVKETSAAWKQVKTDFDAFQANYDKFVRDQRLKEINEGVKEYTNNIGSYSEKVLAKSQKRTVKALQDVGKLFLANYELQQKQLSALQKKNEELANTISGFLTPALDGVFEALVKGEDPFEALQNSVKQLVVELGKAVIKSLILRAVTTAIGGPAGGVGASIGGLGTVRGDALSFFLSRGR